MTQQPYKFMASDAFAYVDTYRRLVMTTPGDISASKERLEAKMNEMNMVPPRLFAELRAHEHAFNFVGRKQDPGMVVLGDQPAESALTQSADDEARQRLQDERDQARDMLRQAGGQIQDLEAALVVQRQETARVRRKLSQTYSTFTVSGVALLLMAVAALVVLLSR